jgi:Uncharacterized conserved protein
MKQNKRKLIGLSIISIIVGVFLMVGSYVAANGKIGIFIDSSGVHYRYKNNPNGILGEFALAEFEQVDIRYSDVDVKFCIADDYGISYKFGAGDLEPEISVEDGVLKVANLTQRVRIDLLSMDWKRGEITVYYPEDAFFEEIKVSAASGNIDIKNIVVNNMFIRVRDGKVNIQKGEINDLNIDVGSGNVNIEDVNAKNMMCKTRDGNNTLRNVSVKANMILDNSSGKIKLKNILAEHLNIIAIDSRIEAEEMQLQGLDIKQTATNVMMSGKLEGESKIISTDGNVTLSLYGEYEDYNYSINVVDGNISLDGKKEAQKTEIQNNAENSIGISTKSGNVTISYE